MQRKSILKDTIQLTVVQFFLEWVSLLLNVWLTHRIGSATVGIVALTGSFFQLAAVAANGNGFLCTSRFVSEELGKPNGNPNRVLGYAIGFCLLLGIPVSALIFCSAEPLSLRFLKSADLAAAVRIFTLILPLGGVCSCLKGYLNAVCRVADPAICDIVECLSRCGVLMLLLQLQSVHTNASVCMAMAYSTGCSTILGFFCLLWFCWRSRLPRTGTCSLSFGRYIHAAIPVLFGGCLTAALSSTNDALIPVTLRQAGNSTELALSQFGTFEAIVIPVLFFSIYHSLCSLRYLNHRSCPCNGCQQPSPLAAADKSSHPENVAALYFYRCRIAVIWQSHWYIVRWRSISRPFDSSVSSCCALHLSGNRLGSPFKGHGAAVVLFPQLLSRIYDSDCNCFSLHSKIRLLRNRALLLR